MPVVAIPGAGAMGAGVGASLVRRGVEVRTLEGRSTVSVARARAAGMALVPAAGIAEADFVLSIVPPDQALAVAEALAPALSAAASKPVYVDCNAVSPTTVGRVAAAVAPTGCRFADVGILGLPPRERGTAPIFYASGDAAEAFATLKEYGLDVRVLDAPVGAASALKLSYAGITKGLAALGAAMTLAAIRGGVAEALRAELAESRREMRYGFSRSIPNMLGKTYRWVAEFDEIAAFVGADLPEGEIFAAMARYYARIGDMDEADLAVLRTFWTIPRDPE